jgi:6-phosphofructokinase 1
VRGITFLGGTILGTTNRGNPFEWPAEDDGPGQTRDRSDELVARFRELGFDALVAIGGDGSLAIAERLSDKGVSVIGVPKTIDNDVNATVSTFGFDTAVSIATDAIDRVHTTAESHQRVMVLEVMGRHAGWIALHAGISGTADAILMPEIPYDIECVARKIRDREQRGRHFSIVVVAEGAMPHGGTISTAGPKQAGRAVKLSGAGERVASAIEERTGKETRTVVLGHLQRGGVPTTLDRLIALRFGTAAVRALSRGERNVMVAHHPPAVVTVPLADATAGIKRVPLDSDTVLTARSLGICLGD